MPPAVPAAPATIVSLFAARVAALSALHTHGPKELETAGTLQGLGLEGTFHTWSSGDDSRFDEKLGVRANSTLRLGKVEYVQNSTGEVRRLRGLLLRRQRTDDFIDSGDWVKEPKYATMLGPATLPDGRAVYRVSLAPPGGQPETIALDSRSSMIDQIAYADSDGTNTDTYYNYRVIDGVLVPFKEVQSNGDPRYDVTQITTQVTVNGKIAPLIFDVPQSAAISATSPLTVPIEVREGHDYVKVEIEGHPFEFLLDTGAQEIVVDARVAKTLGLVPQGQLEISGTKRVSGLQVASLPAIEIGGATVPVGVVNILDLKATTQGAVSADGILGYPFFAAAEVRIDPDTSTLTLAKPGALPALGKEIPVDTDRQLAEIEGTINATPGRFVIDTGNGAELLVFAPFWKSHYGLIPYSLTQTVKSFGIGGSTRMLPARVGDLNIGGYNLYNRNADLMESDTGAFADRFDAGNIGLGSLDEFVTTFDLHDGVMYLSQARDFNDGRYRPDTQP